MHPLWQRSRERSIGILFSNWLGKPEDRSDSLLDFLRIPHLSKELTFSVICMVPQARLLEFDYV